EPVDTPFDVPKTKTNLPYPSRLPSINLNSQRLNKEKQEVKNVVEQPAERRNRIIQSLHNFKVIRKSSTFLKDTSQISLVYAIASILSTKVHEYSSSMGYEHPNTTPKTESDEIIKSGVEELIPIPSECEVTLEDKSKCDMPIQDQSSSVFTTFSNPLFKDNDDLTSSDDESLSEEDVPIEESKIDYLEEFSGELAHINPEITKSDFNFEEEIRLIENLLEEIDIVIKMDDVLPPSVENDDSEGEINAVEELLSDNSIPLTEDEAFDFDNPSVPLPPPEPPDADFNFKLDAGNEISVVMNKFECLRDELDDDDDYYSFMFDIYFKVFSFLSAESGDTIFDPGISV
nr:hypothetical protein [Tanacetum cinerariifolium]